MSSTAVGIGSRGFRAKNFLAAVGLTVAAALGVAGLSTGSAVAGPDDYWVLPHAGLDPAATGMQTVVLAGGCFWGIQAVYQRINGVTSAVSGYAGGNADTATYGEVLRGTTGHAEAVQITYDPSVISFGELLRIFFSVAHNPTHLDRQENDFGPQYRSHIYTTTTAQAEVAAAYIDQLGAAGIYGQPIVTRLDPLTTFFPAEAYHQDYLVNNGAGDPHGPNIGYLAYWDYPKLEHAQQLFPEYWRSAPVLVAQTNPNLVN
jgi:peptide-methionine (S)-S-oxide reductase